MLDALLVMVLAVPFMIVIYFAVIAVVAAIIGTPSAIVRVVYWFEERIWSK